jgi:uncharacterized SAM-binding protein YcdF (DUF218 family)
MGFIKGFLLVAGVALVALAVYFVMFAIDTFSFRPREGKTDAIVVLTGGRGRVEEGVRLFRERKGEWLFFIGVDPAVRKSDLFRKLPAVDEERVLLEKVSRNTLENSLYARELILQHGVGSIRLLTSRYHMKRAVLLFRNVMPKDIAIYPHPVDSKNLREEWWSHGGSFRLLFTEFYKYCLYRVFFLCGGGSELRVLRTAQ